jgi:hypothetical protein
MISTWVAWATGFLGVVLGGSFTYRVALETWARNEHSYARRIRAGYITIRHPVVVPEPYPPNRSPFKPMLSCPFCGGANIDPEGWASTDRKGPACDDCGGSADTVALWNGDRSELDKG